MGKQMNVFNGNDNQTYTFDANPTGGVTSGGKTVTFKNAKKILASHGIYSKAEQDWYGKINRFGWIDVFDHDDISREYLFFTKPNLHIYNDNGTTLSYSQATSGNLQSGLQNIPYFVNEADRHKDALCQLQYNVTDRSNKRIPFMYILTNAVISKLDLPSITPTDSDSTENPMGISLKYRGHSIKSDSGYDFSLTVVDTADLEIYTMVKAYDEYIRLLKVGDIVARDSDVVNHIIPEMFSIYKFLVKSDGETIAYWAKLTGCYFADVPRSDMGDPKNEGGFKYALNFHASFVEDMNPLIISEFKAITDTFSGGGAFVNTFDASINAVDNSWVTFPRIEIARGDSRAVRHSGSRDTSKYFDYRLRFSN
jgi:hypothetical protein